jgi:hypothetical protein
MTGTAARPATSCSLKPKPEPRDACPIRFQLNERKRKVFFELARRLARRSESQTYHSSYWRIVHHRMCLLPQQPPPTSTCGLRVARAALAKLLRPEQAAPAAVALATLLAHPSSPHDLAASTNSRRRRRRSKFVQDVDNIFLIRFSQTRM